MGESKEDFLLSSGNTAHRIKKKSPKIGDLSSIA